MPDILSGYTPDTSFTQTGGGGGFSAGQGGSPGGLDALFAEMAKRKAQERAQQRSDMELQRIRAERAAAARPGPVNPNTGMRPGVDPMRQLEQAAPTSRPTMDSRGAWSDYVDPRDAALANAKAQMLGAGGKAFLGGRIKGPGAIGSNFDDWTSDLGELAKPVNMASEAFIKSKQSQPGQGLSYAEDPNRR